MKARSKSQAVRLGEMARTERGPARPRQCRACLAEETQTRGGVSSLARGICTDRAACEKRQPPLFEGITT